jgi:hypothetical protein
VIALRVFPTGARIVLRRIVAGSESFGEVTCTQQVLECDTTRGYRVWSGELQMRDHPGEIERAILQLFPPAAAGLQKLISGFQKLAESFRKMGLGITARKALKGALDRRRIGFGSGGEAEYREGLVTC